MKSKKGYWIGGALIVLGGLLAVLWLVISFVRLRRRGHAGVILLVVTAIRRNRSRG